MKQMLTPRVEPIDHFKLANPTNPFTPEGPGLFDGDDPTAQQVAADLSHIRLQSQFEKGQMRKSSRMRAATLKSGVPTVEERDDEEPSFLLPQNYPV